MNSINQKKVSSQLNFEIFSHSLRYHRIWYYLRRSTTSSHNHFEWTGQITTDWRRSSSWCGFCQNQLHFQFVEKWCWLWSHFGNRNNGKLNRISILFFVGRNFKKINNIICLLYQCNTFVEFAWEISRKSIKTVLYWSMSTILRSISNRYFHYETFHQHTLTKIN